MFKRGFNGLRNYEDKKTEKKVAPKKDKKQAPKKSSKSTTKKPKSVKTSKKAK